MPREPQSPVATAVPRGSLRVCSFCLLSLLVHSVISFSSSPVLLSSNSLLFSPSHPHFSFAAAASPGQAWGSSLSHRMPLQREAFLDKFTCAPRSGGGYSVDGVSDTEEDDPLEPKWEAQLPCVHARSVNIFSQYRVEAGNVLLMSDIDDTLIASGGWTWIGKSLGGTDNRYARGSDYPGFSALLYLLGLGPHLHDGETGELKVYTPPLQIAVVTGRPNISLFRPDFLLPHIDAILTRGVRQITGEDDWYWKVGSENSMLSPKALKGLSGRGELKVCFGLSTMRRKEPVEGSRVDKDTKFMFIGDTGERDPEVALALASAEPQSLTAVFIHVVHPAGDPDARQTIPEQPTDEEYTFPDLTPLRSVSDGGSFVGAGQKFSAAASKAARSYDIEAGIGVEDVAHEARWQRLAKGKAAHGVRKTEAELTEALIAAEEGRAGPDYYTRKVLRTERRERGFSPHVVIQMEPDEKEATSAAKDFVIDMEPDEEEDRSSAAARFSRKLAGIDEEVAAGTRKGTNSDSPTSLRKEGGYAEEGSKTAKNIDLFEVMVRKLAKTLARAGEITFQRPGFAPQQEEDPHWPLREVLEGVVGQQPFVKSLAAAATAAMQADAAEAADEAAAAAAAEPVQRGQQSGKRRQSHRRPPPPRVSVTDALAGTRRFAIRVGDVLVDAIQVVYDVHIQTEDFEAPRTCSELDPRQAYKVGEAVGQKLRNILDVYGHRWKHTADGLNCSAPGMTGLAAMGERVRRPPPLLFVKCNSVQLHITRPKDPSAWRRFWSFFTESSETIDVHFVVQQDPIDRSSSMSMPSLSDEEDKTVFVHPEQFNKPSIGTPVASFTTTLSAAAHAYVLGLIDLIDVSVIVKKAHEALRSQGSLSSSARLPVVLDHLHDLEALKYLLFSRGAPQSGPVREVSDLIDSLLVSLYAFGKRAAYVRAFPKRQRECVLDLQRSLLDKGRMTAQGRQEGWTDSQGRLVAFGTPFASLVCEHDLELASIQYAGPAELSGLSLILTKVVREALQATERATRDTWGSSSQGKMSLRRSGSPNIAAAGSQDPAEVEVDGSALGLTEECTLPAYKVEAFRKYYAAMCSALAPITCQLLRARLGKPVLQDLLLLAESRAANQHGYIDLPHFGIRVFNDDSVQDYFEVLHQRPGSQAIGFLGATIDYALQPVDEGSGLFEKWPVVDSVSRWKSIEETLGQMLHCNLIS